MLLTFSLNQSHTRRFCKAIDKVIRYFSPKELSTSGDEEIFIKKGSSLVKLKLREIVFVEALENYVTLNTNTDKFTIHFTMKAIENQLPSGVFIRVHRSFIINKSMIQAIKENSLDITVGHTSEKYSGRKIIQGFTPERHKRDGQIISNLSHAHKPAAFSSIPRTNIPISFNARD